MSKDRIKELAVGVTAETIRLYFQGQIDGCIMDNDELNERFRQDLLTVSQKALRTLEAEVRAKTIEEVQEVWQEKFDTYPHKDGRKDVSTFGCWLANEIKKGNR